MFAQAVLTLLALCFSGPIAQTADQPAEPREDRPREERRGDRGPRGERGDRSPRGGWGEEFRRDRERFLRATPEERRQMRMERWVEMTARNYDLNETEKATVRKEMEAIAAERRAQMGADAEEYDKLHDRMMEFFARQPATDGPPDREAWRRVWEDPEFQEVGRRIRELDQKYPFDFMAAVQRVEKVIPPDKVAIGRARWEEQRNRWEQGRNRRDREGGDRDRGPRGERRRNRPGRDGGENPLDAAARAEAERQAEARRRAAEETPASPPRTMHPWEKYVADFIARYEMTEAQSTAAMAILKDVLKRAEQIEQANAPKIAAEQKAKGPAAAEALAKELNKPLDKLFEELKGRLDGLLTAQQRAKSKTV